MELRVVDFSAELLANVQSFECGPDDWCYRAERWIKNAPPFDGALKSMQERGNSVWLYFIDAIGETFLVGFSSLGTIKWRIPSPDGTRREVGFIPMLAVASRFQGKPDKSAERHYVDDMMDHVVEESRKRGHRELCLYVHEDNTRAMRLYHKHGFVPLGTRDGNCNLKMLKLLD